MSESSLSPGAETAQSDADARAALQALIIENPELERLEALLQRFNIFEALGVVRQEIRHSDFLAFVLDPSQTHSLGDLFAKRLLQLALTSSPEASWQVSPIEVALWDLGQLEVQRERHNIDILLTDEPNRLAVIVENKIDSGEHSDQLDRYWRVIQQERPGWRILGLFVTPEGDPPSHDGYLAVGYEQIGRLVEDLIESRADAIQADMRTLMTHYTQMLRRHVVSNSDVAQLCREIYRKHQRALDLIFEHRPDQPGARPPATFQSQLGKTREKAQLALHPSVSRHPGLR